MDQSQGAPRNEVAHRIGGGSIENLRLRSTEKRLDPPGISVLLGGSPQEAADQMRKAFPDRKKYSIIHQRANSVGSATVESICQAGFEVILDPSNFFPNHARLVHSQGVSGFSDDHLAKLSRIFQNTLTPGKNQ